MTTIKKGSELKVGDVIHKSGIVYELKRRSFKNSFWDGKPTMCYFDVNDSYYGPSCCELDLEKEYEIETDRKAIVNYYRITDNDLCKYIAERMEHRRKIGYIFDRVLKKFPRSRS